jgi:precorrin-6B methylase 2
MLYRITLSAAALFLLIATAPAPLAAQNNPGFKPEIGQPGKDVVWVPTPEGMVEKMLDMAKVGPNDFVIDLGSGDGRNVIGAARRGAQALGVEYNPDMVELSRRNAVAAGVADKAKFEQGDMYQADISKASVMALFLLPSNMLVLRPKFEALKPGSRIVSNTFLIQDWAPDTSERLEPCEQWCEAHLWIVPAKVGGTWRVQNGELALTQSYQKLTGTMTAGGVATPVTGSLRGEEIEISGGAYKWTGRVRDGALELTAANGQTTRATRVRQ